jgi:hypothetical protein
MWKKIQAAATIVRITGKDKAESEMSEQSKRKDHAQYA